MSFLWHGLTEQGAQVPVQVDAQGRVIAVDGTPGTNYWDRSASTLSPVNTGDVIKQGSYDSSSDAGVGAYIGGGSIIGQQALGASSTAPVIQVRRGSGDPTINLRSAGEADFASTVSIIGTGTSAAPNISLNANGGLDAVQYFRVESTDDRVAPFRAVTANDHTVFDIGYKDASSVNNGEGAVLRLHSNDANIGDSPKIALDGSNGSANFAGNVTTDGVFNLRGFSKSANLKRAEQELEINTLYGSDVSLRFTDDGSSSNLAEKIRLKNDGSASFAGNITAPNVTFRSSDPRFYVKKSKIKDAPPEYVGPELDLLAEIARLEALVRHLYETLRLTPPAGWPVWDGNDDVLRQLRK